MTTTKKASDTKEIKRYLLLAGECSRSVRISCILMFVALVLAPMTSWRIWKIGPAELCAMVGSLIYFVAECNGRMPRSIFASFWPPFLAIATIGYLYCRVFYSNECDTYGMLTWFYFAFVSTIAFDMFGSLSNIKKLFTMCSAVSILWYLFLYIYSQRISDVFFGANLWYHSVRYSGGGTNPHQVALLMAVASIVTFSRMLSEPIVLKKIVLAVLTCLGYFLLAETQSSTAKMAFALGAVFALYRLIGNAKLRLAVLCVVASLALIFHETLISEFNSWIASDSNGAGRFELFATITEPLDKSPVFGLGPGNHASGGSAEFHNTYLEIFAMAGFTGLFLFTFFSFQLLSIVRKDHVALATLIALYGYGFSGFGMRRLVYWLLLTMMVAFAQRSSSKVPVSNLTSMHPSGGGVRWQRV